jgi:hypothetical protein
MTKPNSQPATVKPIVVLYGMSDGKGRAGVFKGPDIEPALKAAGLLKFSVLAGESDEARKLARELPPGRIQAKGQNIAPFVRRDLFERLAAIAQKERGSGGEGPGKDEAGVDSGGLAETGKPRLPTDWTDIKRGDLVLAQGKDPAEGWWQVIVVDVTGDLIKLRWPDEPRGRPVLKPRLALGLMFAGDPGKPFPSNVKSNSKDGPVAAYPNNWGEIGVGHVVLAKEDGPMQQFWEAKITSQEGDLFTLAWRDHPKLPPVTRQRLELALVHPNPKAR